MPSETIDHAVTPGPLTGAASDPTYAGALSFMRRKYTKDLTGADVAVLGVPFDAAVSNRPGARFGPQAIRRASAIMDNDPQYPFSAELFEHLAIVDLGDVLLDHGNHQKTPGAIETAARAVIDKDVFLLGLGGDHFVTWPLLKAHAAKHGPLALVQFDAHQDTWFDDGERIDHGSFVRRAVRDGIVDADRSIQIGIRTHAPDDCGIEILYGHQVEEMGAVEIAEAIYERVGGGKAYITFDIDCLDPAFAPGTGTPVAGGPSSARMLATLMHLKNLQLVGADVVEVAPAYDHADITAIAGAAVAMHYLGLLAARKAGR
ncbi:MAG: agmatinase [Roseitalea sp.]|jgi:agmatinase|nr:agmatinase [Roseitalea sp.]MBO6741269.1 agmatinase [Roseitalea sp.]